MYRNNAELTGVRVDFNKCQRETTTDVRLLTLLNVCLTEPQQERPTVATDQLPLCFVFGNEAINQTTILVKTDFSYFVLYTFRHNDTTKTELRGYTTFLKGYSNKPNPNRNLNPDSNHNSNPNPNYNPGFLMGRYHCNVSTAVTCHIILCT